jgi:HEAT repeats
VKILCFSGMIMVLAALLLACGSSSCDKDRGPTYLGRPLEYWFFRVDTESGATAERGERMAVDAVGTNAIPTFLSWMRAGSQAPRFPSLIQRSNPDAVSLHWMGSEGLALLGGRAAPAVPALIQLTGSRDPDVRRAALHALQAIGPRPAAFLPALRRLANDPNRLVAGDASIILKELASGERGLSAGRTRSADVRPPATRQSTSQHGPAKEGPK